MQVVNDATGEITLRGLEDLDELEGARVLVRTDLRQLGAVMPPSEDFRLLGTLSTLDWLRERGASVALCSTVPGEDTLQPTVELLRAVWGMDVQLVQDALAGNLPTRLESLSGRGVLLLENLASHDDELRGDEEFARRLMAPFTHYVSDGFASCHERHASVAVIPAMLPEDRAAAGRSLQVEVDALTCLMNREDRPFVTVVAGRCLQHKLSAVERLLERSDRLVCGGDVALAMLSVDGHDVGRSCLDATCLDAARKVRERAAAGAVQLVVPVDLFVEGHDRPLPVAEVDPEARVLDVGPRSLEAAATALDGAHTAFWYGQMAPSDGRSDPASDHAVARAMTGVHGYSVSAGMEILSRLAGTDLAQHISHVASGGQAALAYIGGERLPGLVPLES
jgi:phosphoglycerate kinase